MVYDPCAPADRDCLTESFGQPRLRADDSLFERIAAGEARGDRSGEGTTRSVKPALGDSCRRQVVMNAVDQEDVSAVVSTREMTALDEHGPGPEASNSLSGELGLFQSLDLETGECPRLRKVWGDQGGVRDEQGPKCLEISGL